MWESDLRLTLASNNKLVTCCLQHVFGLWFCDLFRRKDILLAMEKCKFDSVFACGRANCNSDHVDTKNFVTNDDAVVLMKCEHRNFAKKMEVVCAMLWTQVCSSGGTLWRQGGSKSGQHIQS